GLSDVELASVRRRGHAVCVGDADDAYTGVAVPIRDHRGAVVAAIAGGGARLRGTGARRGVRQVGLGRAFYAVAALDGMMFGVLALSVPMHLEALHRPASLAGEVLATGTVAVAG